MAVKTTLATVIPATVPALSDPILPFLLLLLL